MYTHTNKFAHTTRWCTSTIMRTHRHMQASTYMLSYNVPCMYAYVCLYVSKHTYATMHRKDQQHDHLSKYGCWTAETVCFFQMNLDSLTSSRIIWQALFTSFYLNSGTASWHMNAGNVAMMLRKMIWTGCLWICYADVPAAKFKKMIPTWWGTPRIVEVLWRCLRL